MPNRILRDWTDSVGANSLSWQAEVFFVRLIMKADDYGRFSANAKLLRSLLFPIRDGLREADISRWLAECQTAGMIRLYSHEEKPLLEIVKFKQQHRSPSKYPEPPEECVARDEHLISNAHLGGGVFGGGDVKDSAASAPRGRATRKALTDTPGFSAFWTAYPRKVAKGEARVAWEQMQCEGKLQEILATIKTAAVSRDWRKDNGQFIPHPATWLRREGWSDVYGNNRTFVKKEPVADPEGWRDWLAKWGHPYSKFANAMEGTRAMFQRGELP